MISRLFVAAAMTAWVVSPVWAVTFDEYAAPSDAPDLALPAQVEKLGTGRKSMMFKPEGAGPFPALVIMPTCYGHLYSVNTFDWARRAVAHGYAALVVDPLAPRGVESNCERPLPIPGSRLLKDAFDAASHLRRQPFVDPARVGLLGFSQGAITGLVASGAVYSHPPGRDPFRAIVSVYPVCLYDDFPMPGKSEPVDMPFVPEKIVVPLLVEIGDEDTRGGPAMSHCPTLLEKRKTAGDPVSYVIFHATHVWDHRELASREEHVRGAYGQEIIYRYDPAVTKKCRRTTANEKRRPGASYSNGSRQLTKLSL